MARKNSAGAMFHTVGFEKKSASTDGLGGTQSTWAEDFNCRAEFIHVRGGETVMAARLEGRHTQVIRVRSFSDSRSVTTDWRIVDKHTNEIYNIRDITPTKDRRKLDMLCERGVAT